MEEIDIDLTRTQINDKLFIGYGISYPYLNKSDKYGYIEKENNTNALVCILDTIIEERGIKINVFFDIGIINIADVEIEYINILSKKCTHEIQNRYTHVNNLAHKGVQKVKTYSVKLKRKYSKTKPLKINTTESHESVNKDKDKDISNIMNKKTTVSLTKRKKKIKKFNIET